MTDETKQPEEMTAAENREKQNVIDDAAIEEQKTVEIPATTKSEPIQFSVQIHPDDVPGMYSNAVSVRVQSQEVVLDFGYIVPKMSENDKDIIQLVKRVNLPIATAGQMARLLMNAMQASAFDQMMGPKS